MKYFFALIAILLVSNVAHAQELYSPEGLWLTENKRSVIKVEKCGSENKELCGSIYWIIKDGMQTDSKNPDAALRGQKMCGLEIMRDLTQSRQNGNYWLDGEIYKADDGDTYNAKVQVTSPNAMTLRGYRGISLLGKSQDWTRVSAKDYPACQ